ncbi:UNVERIFIED_CONTAM: hypothetical protein Sradi_5278600 [Sesamum radiatum]|uniref:Uncharacterized protein n=1 Tax=Sesamum radiatum TaxID=300843 RepID=A0AAW2LR38_SESRA
MEEAVIEDRKKGEEKRKSTYIKGEPSRLPKKGNGRSFSDGGRSFSRSGFTSRGNGGSRFSGPVGFNRGSAERSTFSTPSIGSSRGTGQSGGRGSTFVQNCFTCGRRHLGSCRRLDDIAKTCYNCGGRGHIAGIALAVLQV